MKCTFSAQKINKIASFTQINSFSCFFRKVLNNSPGFITPVLKKWRNRIKTLVAAQVDKFGMNFLCNINQSFADLLINYLNLIKERSNCSEVFCKKGVLRNFPKCLSTPFYKEYLWWLLLKK